MPAHAPLFSVIIPTRERYSTLGASIATVLDQPERDLEVIVSDNMSADATPNVVQSFSDKRLVSLRSGRRMSMSDHWDYALEHARGEYIIIIGDDDGFMPHALDLLKNIILRGPAEAYYWDKHIFAWPRSAGKNGQITYCHEPREIRAMGLVERAKDSLSTGLMNWGGLPKVYHAAVKKSVLDQLRRRTGRVFHTTIPDVFMAFALPALVTSVVDVGFCATIDGVSSASIGRSLSSRRPEVMEKFLHEYLAYIPEPTLPSWLPLQFRFIGDAPLVAMAMFPECYHGVDFNYEAFLADWSAANCYNERLKSFWYPLRGNWEIRPGRPFAKRQYLSWWFKIRASQARQLVRSAIRRPLVRLSLRKNKARDVRECARVLGELDSKIISRKRLYAIEPMDHHIDGRRHSESQT